MTATTKRIIFWGAIIIVLEVALLLLIPRKGYGEVKMPPMAVTPVQAQISVPIVDSRLAELNRFFAAHRCTYSNSAVYIATADEYGIDYRLLPALSVQESSCGLHYTKNNLFGFGRKEFPSIEVGIDYVASQLANGTYYKNKTLKQKLQTYNSINPSYYSEILGLMNQVK